jgi:Domain of unknown function (DUF4252)
MKKLIIIWIITCMVTTLKAQTRAIDEMFDKYSERDGFTTVYISSKLLSLFAGDRSKDGTNIAVRLKSIRILSVEDSLLNNSVNFYKELSGKQDLSAYEELMAVREGSNVTKFLIRQKGEIITELIVITGGPGDNTLISITGDLDMKMISELSKSTGIDELKELDDIEKKSPEN